MVWTCRAQHRLDCRSTQAECGCTEKIWQAKEIMGWSAWEWQKEARYGFFWPSKSFWVERTPLRKTCQKAQPSVEENRALKWIWWWWWAIKLKVTIYSDIDTKRNEHALTGLQRPTWPLIFQSTNQPVLTSTDWLKPVLTAGSVNTHTDRPFANLASFFASLKRIYSTSDFTHIFSRFNKCT